MNSPPPDSAAAVPWRLDNVEKRVDQLDKELDTKAAKSDVNRIESKVNWLIGSLFVLTLTIASSVITLILALGGSP